MRMLVQWILLMAILMAAVFLLWWGSLYTPYYSRVAVEILSVINDYDEPNSVLAHHLKADELSGQDFAVANLRQAYLELLEEKIRFNQSDDLAKIYSAYQAKLPIVQQEVLTQKSQEIQTHQNLPQKISELSNESKQQAVLEQVLEQANTTSSDLPQTQHSIEVTEQLKQINAYKQQLLEYVQQNPTQENVTDELFKDIAEVHAKNRPNLASHLQSEQPSAIVVLGGGLTRDKQTKQIIVNKYTEKRLEKAVEVVKSYPNLPLLLSGVEANYMQEWLKTKHNFQAQLLENKSFNTCENTRFTSLLLQELQGSPIVILLTDEYHMPRTQRLFAEKGIKTIPIFTPMPEGLTQGTSDINYDHSRRANYEILASFRDKIVGSKDCRDTPK